ncbi:MULTISPECIES: hypothetical protein [Bacteroidales]|uniref:hypothetical protein n=1 Tax=Bacteroidales TaxID=171549 RepID=UPI0006ACE9FA|nr:MULTISPECIES: hypothetical protein [Bacteroidales]MDB0677169.1 hypothetical protein [Barnesiella intestinihominis]MDB9069963.1 hypothetical protein [Parabacteroides distasonis]MDB9181616.1 hypothetical protein [Parabacteroides distasonis]MDC1709183.1 hypothetical protein [Phocaeicola vulgatus]MDC1712242.1 hypothetical protein [Phocaeicola vulgatus]
MGFYGCGLQLSVQLHTTAFPANYSFTERKNLQEMHFKPEDQARQQTFASDKTKAGAAGMKPENNKVKRIEKEEPG